MSFINQIRALPIKTLDNRMISGKVSVKIYDSVQEGLSFVALVQTVNENKVTLITNLDG
jgi:hypothetical protein